MTAAAEGNFDRLKSIVSSGGEDGRTEVGACTNGTDRFLFLQNV